MSSKDLVHDIRGPRANALLDECVSWPRRSYAFDFLSRTQNHSWYPDLLKPALENLFISNMPLQLPRVLFIPDKVRLMVFCRVEVDRRRKFDDRVKVNPRYWVSSALCNIISIPMFPFSSSMISKILLLVKQIRPRTPQVYNLRTTIPILL